MALNANKIRNTSSVKYDNIEPGPYPSRVVRIIDMGLQPQRAWKGEEKPPKNEVAITYECLDEFLPDEDGNPDETKPRWQHETLPLHNISQDKGAAITLEKSPPNLFFGSKAM